MPCHEPNRTCCSLIADRLAKPTCRSKSKRSAHPFQQVHDDAHPEERQPIGAEHLVQQIRETADKLIRDGATRGDLKLLSTALKELRYCLQGLHSLPQHPQGDRLRLGPAAARATPPIRQAVEFGRRMAEAGYMVITGAASGIMEAGHVGAGRENSIGVNILLPFEQHANPIIAGDRKLMHLKYFFTRKLLFVKESDAVALFPGGFGTQDEGFEVLTLVQTGKSHLFPIVMVDAPGGDYWTRWQRLHQDVLLARRPDLPRRPVAVPDHRFGGRGRRRGAAFLPRLPQHALRRRRPGAASAKAARRGDCWNESATEFADIVVAGTFEQTAALPGGSQRHPPGPLAAAAVPLRSPQPGPAAT